MDEVAGLAGPWHDWRDVAQVLSGVAMALIGAGVGALLVDSWVLGAVLGFVAGVFVFGTFLAFNKKWRKM